MGNDGKCWNTSAESNGYDLCVVVRDFLRENGFERLSIAEVLWSEGREGAGQRGGWAYGRAVRSSRSRYSTL